MLFEGGGLCLDKVDAGCNEEMSAMRAEDDRPEVGGVPILPGDAGDGERAANGGPDAERGTSGGAATVGVVETLDDSDTAGGSGGVGGGLDFAKGH